MGSIITSLTEDYEDYVHFCNTIGCKTVYICDEMDFYTHQRMLLGNLGFKDISDYFVALNKTKRRDEQINNILND